MRPRYPGDCQILSLEMPPRIPGMETRALRGVTVRYESGFEFHWWVPADLAYFRYPIRPDLERDPRPTTFDSKMRKDSFLEYSQLIIISS